MKSQPNKQSVRIKSSQPTDLQIRQRKLSWKLHQVTGSLGNLSPGIEHLSPIGRLLMRNVLDNLKSLEIELRYSLRNLK